MLQQRRQRLQLQQQQAQQQQEEEEQQQMQQAATTNESSPGGNDGGAGSDDSSAAVEGASTPPPTRTAPAAPAARPSTISTASTATTAPVPPPQLVSSLRLLFGSDSTEEGQTGRDEDDDDDEDDDGSNGGSTGSFGSSSSPSPVLPSLLRSVFAHPIFASDVITGSSNVPGGHLNANAGTTEEAKDAPTETAPTNPGAANLEAIVGNAVRLATAGGVGGGGNENDGGGSSNRSDNQDAAQALIIAALSVLTSTLPQEQARHHRQGSNSVLLADNKGDEVEATIAPAGPPTEKVSADQVTVQVGGVLALLGDLSGIPSTTTNARAASDAMLSSGLLTYLCEAASTYEERIEIQKERVLARMAAERQRKEREARREAEEALKRGVKHAEEDSVKELTKKIQAAVSASAAAADSAETAGRDRDSDEDLTPVDAGTAAETPSRGGTGGDDEQQQGAVVEVDEGAEVLAVGDEEVVLDDVAGLPRASLVDPSSRPGVEDEDEDDTHSDDENADDAEEVQEAGISVIPALDDGSSSDDSSSPSSESSHSDEDDALGDDEQADEGGDIDDEYNSEADEDEEEDDEDEESDDEDAAMLARALALSLAEHNAAMAAQQDHQEEGEESSGSHEPDGAGQEGQRSVEHETVASADAGGAIELLATPRAASSGAADPASQTPVSDKSAPGDSEGEEEEEDLPLLPAPPAAGYPYESNVSSEHTIDAATAAEDLAAISPYLDPSSLQSFGALPLPTVLLHLLRSALGHLVPKPIPEKEKATNSTSTYDGRDLSSSCAVGVGASLFPPTVPPETGPACSSPLAPAKFPSATASGLGGDTMLPANSATAHLLIALLSMLSSTRNDLIEALRTAQAERSSYDASKAKARSPGDSFDEKEVDDPATALAISPVAASYSRSTSSENLESKGLKRKAAAAAQVEALRRESAERRAANLGRSVAAYSSSIWLVMRCLRTVLAAEIEVINVAAGVDEDALSDRDDFCRLLSSGTRSNLSAALAAFTPSVSSDTTMSDNSLGDVLFSAPLRREALLLWKESIPCLYPKQDDRVGVLTHLIRDCYPTSDREASGCTSSDHNESLLKLMILCQRLRHTDMLDRFASLPMQFDPSDCSSNLMAEEQALTREPSRLHPIIALLAPVATRLPADAELSRLYCALCSRATRLLLWDSSSLDPSADEMLGEHGSASASGEGSGLRLKASPSSFDFDRTKCADSIAIIANSPGSPNGIIAHQRASKVWGTVLGTAPFHPKTGIHRFAVRLDKCERGHVFVGVATSQASVKTYVGGDKYGWGVIGTQALWHDRSKIRGDYGATFRTGATVVITIDTDAGTLSFGLWKDPQQSSQSEGGASAMLASPTSLASPRRSGSSLGSSTPVLEDWGVAFEGLPLNARLYPAIGLYQRDDKVTLLSAASSVKGGGSSRGGGPFSSTAGGGFLYPRGSSLKNLAHQEASLANRVCSWNEALNSDAIAYASAVLSESVSVLSSGHGTVKPNQLIDEILPSLASSLCFQTPSTPVLSGRTAIALLPLLTQCATLLDRYAQSKELIASPLNEMKPGKWAIRATPSSPSSSASSGARAPEKDVDEYVVSLKQEVVFNENSTGFGIHGMGIGTSGRFKNGHVTITGCVRGSSLTFVEEWHNDGSLSLPTLSRARSSSSCVIEARLSADGARFEGTYRNIQFDTSGKIAGAYHDPTRACFHIATAL